MEQSVVQEERGPGGFSLPSARAVLRVLTGVVWVLGALFAVRVLMATNSDWSILPVILIFGAFTAACWLVGAWALVFRKQQRRAAGVLMALSLAFLCLPVMSRSYIDAPVTMDFVAACIGVCIAATLVWAILWPAKSARKLPGFLFSSRVFNYSLLVLIAVCWFLPIVAAALFASGEASGGAGQGSPGMGAAVVIVMFAYYLVAVGIVSVLVGTWGWLGLRRGGESGHRVLHIIQILSALPTIIIGVLVLTWLVGQALN